MILFCRILHPISMDCKHITCTLPKIEEMIYSVNEGGETLYGKTDLKVVNSQETLFQDHSPLLVGHMMVIQYTVIWIFH